MTITEFLLARITEDEEDARDAYYEGQRWLPEEEAVIAADKDWDPILFLDRKKDARHASNWSPGRVLVECESRRRIIEWHKSWPVLVETEPVFEQADSTDVNSMTLRMSKQIAWTTEQKYRKHFGTEPPTGPILRFMVQPYADHPDYRDEWRA